jgi:hypothetical protein
MLAQVLADRLLNTVLRIQHFLLFRIPLLSLIWIQFLLVYVLMFIYLDSASPGLVLAPEP